MGLIDDYPGLRLLRSLSLGYHIAPLRGFRWKIKTFDWGFVICRRIGFGGARGWEVRVGWFAARAERSALPAGGVLRLYFPCSGPVLRNAVSRGFHSMGNNFDQGTQLFLI